MSTAGRFKLLAAAAVVMTLGLAGCGEDNGANSGEGEGGGGDSTVTTYTITFNPNGGTVSPTSGKTGTDGKLASLPTPTRSDYTFDGWYTTATGGDSVTLNKIYSANATIYARWTTTGGGNPSVGEIEMVSVAGGTFTMGCTSEQGSDCDLDESPSHSVTLSNFSIGKYEVTQGQWKAVMGSNPSSDCGSYGIGDNYPVYCVSWNEVQTFISRLNSQTGKNYRLPTEAEWEYAARGGNSSGYKYSGSNNIDDVAWYWGNNGSSGTSTYGTKPVGTKSPNELGIYDMSGNVYEWVSDWSGSYSSSAVTNPTGPNTGSSRVLRGGSWYDGAWYGRVSSRHIYDPDIRDYNLGFRLVLSP